VGQVHGGDGLADVFRNDQGAGEFGVGEDDCELFAAEARGPVGAALEGSCDDVCDAAQALVAADVTVDIVVGLEEIDVHEKDGDGFVGADGASPFGFELLVEATAVGEAGEGIGVGELTIAVFALLQGELKGLALLKQGGHGEGGEESDGDKDLLDHDAMQHGGAGDEHERPAAFDGEADGDAGDDEDSKNGAGKA